MRPIEKLELITDSLKIGRPPPDHLQAWLTDCLSKWQAGATLADAFFIYDSGSERMTRRNALLHQYHQLQTNQSEWQTAKLIRNQLKTGKLSPVIDAANRIYPLPKTTTRIYDLLKLNSI